MRKLAATLTAFVYLYMITLFPFAALAATNSYTVTVTTTFTPLHLYYMAASGCDNANAGTSAASPWCQPDNDGHVSLVCGDVIIAAAGTYTDIAPTHSPSSCPSTSGGIDGTGGIQFAVVLCGGTDLEACQVSNSSGNAVELEDVDNWAIEGFKVTNGGSNGRAFESKNCETSGSASHHHAFINNIAYNTAQAFGMNDCGDASSKSVDYWFVVGNIAQNGAQDGICLAAIDAVGPGVLDNNSGTHFYMYNNFSYAHVNTDCRTVSDTEAFMLDTVDFHDVNSTFVVANNIGYDSDRMGLQLYWQDYSSDTPTVKVYNNTFFQNNTHTGGENLDGEININNNGGSPALPWTVIMQNNIAYQPLTSSSGGGNVTAFALYGAANSFTNGGSGSENFFKASNTSCIADFCDTGYNAEVFSPGTSAMLGTNTYTNPAFTNTSDLLANQIGVPNCSGFENVTQCMGYDAVTGTLTTPSVISDLTPTASGSTSKGFQRPTMSCSSNADFPTALKGIVYLHWTGSIVEQRAGLANVPCGM
ncbi:MAG TPA: hypothetical protein VHA37_01875 [Candidatus Saccharimonadales bacterium]|nr:hypothetical protein [Candidatus Saccharimonadales bacterium]